MPENELYNYLSRGENRVKVLLPYKPCIPEFPFLVRIGQLHLKEVSISDINLMQTASLPQTSVENLARFYKFP